VVDAYAVRHLGVSPVIATLGSNLLQVVMLGPLFARGGEAARRRMRGQWVPALAVGVLSPLAYVLVLRASGMGATLERGRRAQPASCR